MTDKSFEKSFKKALTAAFEPAFNDHAKMKLVKVVVYNVPKKGQYKIAVFDNGSPSTFSTGKYEFEYQGPDGGQATTTRRFSAVTEAVTHAKKSIHEAIARDEKAAKQAAKSPARKAAEASAKNVAFFVKMSGYGRPGSKERYAAAKKLALAEKHIEDKGWTVEWSWDETADPADHEGAKEILSAVLKNEHGKVIGSLGGISDPDRDYRRLIEAELALEAMG